MYDANSVSPSACVSGSIDHPLARMHRWVMNKYTQQKKKNTRKLVLEVFFNLSLPEETTVILN